MAQESNAIICVLCVQASGLPIHHVAVYGAQTDETGVWSDMGCDDQSGV